MHDSEGTRTAFDGTPSPSLIPTNEYFSFVSDLDNRTLHDPPRAHSLKGSPESAVACQIERKLAGTVPQWSVRVVPCFHCASLTSASHHPFLRVLMTKLAPSSHLDHA